MKHFHTSAIALLMLLLATPLASAYDIEYDGLYYNLISENDEYCVEVTTGPNCDYTGMTSNTYYSGNIVIPSSISYSGLNLPVKAIGENAFKFCTDVVSISIPNSIKKISNNAFYGAKSIKQISIPGSVEQLGSNLFSDDHPYSHLPGINYDSYMMDYVKLEKVTFEQGIKRVSGFNCIRSLKEVVLPDGIEEIGKYAFAQTSIKSINIPNSVKIIGSNAFYWCSDLQDIDFTKLSNLEAILGHAFAMCDLKYVILPDNVKTCGYDAFRDNPNMRYFDFGNGVERIERCIGSFPSTRTKINTVIIGDGATTVDNDAFELLDSLNVVVLGESLSKIGWNSTATIRPFNKCTNLTKIIARNPNPPTIDENTFAAISYLKAKLIVPSQQALEEYKAADYWKKFLKMESGNWKGFDAVFNLPDTSIADIVVKDSDGNIITTADQIKPLQTLNFEITPKEGYSFNTILANGAPIDGTSFIMHTDATFDFLFNKSFHVSIENTDPDKGSISIFHNGIEIPSGSWVEENTELTVIAYASAGYTVKNFTLNGEILASNHFTVTKNSILSATFEESTLVPEIPEYEAPLGTMHSGKQTYVAHIFTEGAATNIDEAWDSCPRTLHTVMPTAIVAAPGSSITVNLEGYSLGEGSTTIQRQDLRYCTAHIYTDWDGTKQFNGESAQYGIYTPSAVGDMHIYGNYDDVMNISHTVNVPTDASGHGRIRVIYQGAWKTHVTSAYPSYVQDGVTYDLPVYVAKTTAIDVITDGDGFDSEQPIEYYNLQGMKMQPENLRPGIYIARQGSRVKKIMIR